MKDVKTRKPAAKKGVASDLDFNAYARFFEKNDLDELLIEEKDTRIHFRKSGPLAAPAGVAYAMPAPAVQAAAPAAAAPAPAAVEAPVAEDGAEFLKVVSPLNGTFYSASGPDKPAFASVGATVSAGSVLCIVEAMKVFNEIKSEHAGKVVRILAKNGDAVRDGQELFWIKP